MVFRVDSWSSKFSRHRGRASGPRRQPRPSRCDPCLLVRATRAVPPCQRQGDGGIVGMSRLRGGPGGGRNTRIVRHVSQPVPCQFCDSSRSRMSRNLRCLRLRRRCHWTRQLEWRIDRACGRLPDIAADQRIPGRERGSSRPTKLQSILIDPMQRSDFSLLSGVWACGEPGVDHIVRHRDQSHATFCALLPSVHSAAKRAPRSGNLGFFCNKTELLESS